MDVAAGELVWLGGAPGSGKSPFPHVVGRLVAPAAGEIRFAGRDLFEMSDPAVADFRNRTIGFVFQSHYLLPEFTALENVAMPALIQRWERGSALRRARELLLRVGLGKRIDHRPGELAGGEAQRASLARALG